MPQAVPALVKFLRAGGAAAAESRSRCGDLTTWTVLQNDDPNHLGLRCNAFPGRQMALITSGCVPFRLTVLCQVFDDASAIIGETPAGKQIYGLSSNNVAQLASNQRDASAIIGRTNTTTRLSAASCVCGGGRVCVCVCVCACVCVCVCVFSRRRAQHQRAGAAAAAGRLDPEASRGRQVAGAYTDETVGVWS